MKSTIEVIPGLTLHESMYELAAEGVAAFAPHLDPLTWERFTDPTLWLNIPDADGQVSKTELTLLCGVEATVKLNMWWRPDIRGGDEVVPHNHRWNEFRGHVLRGAYREVRFRRVDVDPETGRAEVVMEPAVTHASPAVNTVPHEVFHEVVEVEPATMSLMVCGRGEFGDWCHLDTATGRLRRDQPVAGFEEAFRALNPQRYPARVNDQYESPSSVTASVITPLLGSPAP
jgi:hypothetical protein